MNKKEKLGKQTMKWKLEVEAVGTRSELIKLNNDFEALVNGKYRELLKKVVQGWEYQ
jgi:hypothetical protein